ncbi:MAG: glycosyltransferase [Chloroflexota bacterium]|nr:glycosyltransferase [Chloroflexota bacterium]
MSEARVAFISFHASPLAAPGEGKAGGMNVYVRQLARALGSAGIPVDVFTREHRPGSTPADMVENLSGNTRVIHLPAGQPDTPMEDFFDLLPGFLAEMQDFTRRNGLQYRAVHSHYWLSGWLGQAFSRWLDIPHVITFHTLSRIKMQSRPGEREPLQRQEVEEQIISSADRIVAFSPHERDAMARLYGADVSRVQLAPCGVDLGTFRPLDREESRRQLGLNGDKVLLCVGRIESLKGVELLVRATAQLDTCEPVRVLVVGDDNGQDREVDRLRELAESLEVGDTIDFVGRVAQEELPVYYSAADVCVVPSFYESFGLAALESMACGTPVVASRVGGLSTVIQHGSTGYLKSWRCPEAFANSVEMLISSKSLQHSMGLAARRRAEDMSWDKVAEQIAGIYDILARERAASGAA